MVVERCSEIVLVLMLKFVRMVGVSRKVGCRRMRKIESHSSRGITSSRVDKKSVCGLVLV